MLEQTFFTGDVRRRGYRQAPRLYYGAIGRAADEIADYAEKQGFLKAMYEDFYKAYNPAAADRLGVVYTPNEVVDFIIRGDGPPAAEALRTAALADRQRADTRPGDRNRHVRYEPDRLPAGRQAGVQVPQ